MSAKPGTKVDQKGLGRILAKAFRGEIHARFELGRFHFVTRSARYVPKRGDGPVDRNTRSQKPVFVGVFSNQWSGIGWSRLLCDRSNFTGEGKFFCIVRCIYAE